MYYKKELLKYFNGTFKIFNDIQTQFRYIFLHTSDIDTYIRIIYIFFFDIH